MIPHPINAENNKINNSASKHDKYQIQDAIDFELNSLINVVKQKSIENRY